MCHALVKAFFADITHSFGASYNDGYGVNCDSVPIACLDYWLIFIAVDLAGPESIKFGIESKHSCQETSTQLFGQAIFTALREMKAAIIQAQTFSPARSRL